MSNDKMDPAVQAAMEKISTINAVEGFDPTPLAVQYDDLNAGGSRWRLPVLRQIAWFRACLKNMTDCAKSTK